MGSKHQVLASCDTQSHHKRFDEIYFYYINYQLHSQVIKKVNNIDRVPNRQAAGQPKWTISMGQMIKLYHSNDSYDLVIYVKRTIWKFITPIDDYQKSK